jgi:4-hydroxy-4-methyl-2-oxoglutarate aldolase
MESSPIPAVLLEELRSLGTCTVANAIEQLGVRLFNEGFTNSSLRSQTPALPPVAAYAVPVRIRCSSPPPVGPSYIESTQWWDYIRSFPQPRFVVIEDVDPFPGTGALVGQIHAAILKALGCVAVATNGGVRDLPSVAATGFALFAGNLAVSHTYAHIVEIGSPVKIAGLAIAPGDLLLGDLHGLLSIPITRSAEIISIARQLIDRERQLLSLCSAGAFPLEQARELIRGFRTHPLPH